MRIRRAIASQILDTYFSDIATWAIPSGGFYIWLTLTQPISMQKLFTKALDNDLLIHPGNIYDNLSNRHLRLSYSYASISELKSGLRLLSNIIRNMMK